MLLDASGKDVAHTRTADGVIKAQVDPQRSYMLAPPTPERQALRPDGLHLPARYVTFGPTGAAKTKRSIFAESQHKFRALVRSLWHSRRDQGGNYHGGPPFSKHA